MRLRPDLTRPAPADLTALGARAATRASVQRALDRLSADQLRVLEALLVGGERAAPALLDAPPRTVRSSVQTLWDQALVWRSPEGYRAARAVPEIMTSPARLGPTAKELAVPDRSDTAPAAYAALGESARAAIDRLIWTHPRGGFAGHTNPVRTELIESGLVVGTEDGVVIPREVGLALRDGRLYEDGLSAPAAPSDPGDTARVDSAAAGEALEILWRIDELAHLWEVDQPRVLRSGGLSVRDHKAAAAALDASLEFAAFVIEVAYAARLVGSDGDFEPHWLPTRSYDEWSAESPADRWAVLATAWWDSTRAPFLAGTTSEHGTINVLSADVGWPMIRNRRADVLRVLADLEPGQSAAPDYLDRVLHWRRPLRLPQGAPTRAPEILREAQWLGVAADGALSGPGRAVLDGADAAAAMDRALPEPVDHVLVQADLTAVAPGPLTDSVGRLMQSCADIESRGGATVYRFTERSVRRALDAGVSAADLTERISAASRTPIPQPLEYLIADIGRRHGQTRVGAASCYLRSDDSAGLDAMLADRRLSALQLRKIAPSVLISPAPAATVLELARKAGFSPVAEGPDGQVVHTGRDRPRAPDIRDTTPIVRLEQVDDQLIDTLIERLRGAESKAAGRPESTGPRIPSTDPTVTLTRLQDAAADNAPVWIGYVDADGELRRTLFRPAHVDGGRATGTIGERGDTRTFSIHRISGVTPA